MYPILSRGKFGNNDKLKISFIFRRKTGKKAVNYLDDFYFVALLKAFCDGQIRASLQIRSLINFPVALEKTVWGCTQIVFLGFLIDSVRRIVGIPAEKVEKAIN